MMMLFTKILMCIVVGVMSFCAVVLTIDAHRTSVQLIATLKDVSKIEKSSADMLEATYATEATIANLADTMNGIASDLHANEAAQLKQAQQASEKLTLLFADADLAVKGVQGTINTTNEAIVKAAQDVHETLEASQEMLQAGTDQLKDPALKESVQQLLVATKNTAKATGEVNATMVSVHKGVDYEVAQLMKPVSKIKSGILIGASVLGNILHGFL